MVAYQSLVDTAMQQQACLWQLRRSLEHLFSTQILGAEDHPSVVARADERIGETVDRRIQNCAAELVAIRGKIGPPAGEPEP
jgi:hypothetical protein